MARGDPALPSGGRPPRAKGDPCRRQGSPGHAAHPPPQHPPAATSSPVLFLEVLPPQRAPAARSPFLSGGGEGDDSRHSSSASPAPGVPESQAAWRVVPTTALRAQCCCFLPQRRKQAQRVTFAQPFPSVGTTWNSSQPTAARVPLRCSSPPPPTFSPQPSSSPRTTASLPHPSTATQFLIALRSLHTLHPTWNSRLAQSRPW